MWQQGEQGGLIYKPRAPPKVGEPCVFPQLSRQAGPMAVLCSGAEKSPKTPKWDHYGGGPWTCVSPCWSPLPRAPGWSSAPTPSPCLSSPSHPLWGHCSPLISRQAHPCRVEGLNRGRRELRAQPPGCRTGLPAGGEARGGRRSSSAHGCGSLDSCSTRGWHREGFGQVTGLGSGRSPCRSIVCFALVPAPKKSRRPLPRLRAAPRPRGWALLAQKPENLWDQSTSSPDSRTKVTTKHRWVAPGSVRVAEPAGVAGCRPLAPPAEERGAVFSSPVPG